MMMIDNRQSKVFIGCLLMAVLLMRISAIQDGLSERAVVDGATVGWWSWHLFGWLARDVVQVILLYLAGRFLILRGWITWLAWYGFHAGLQWLLHLILYGFAVQNRQLFLW